MNVKIICLEPINGHQAGVELEVSEREAKQLVGKRLAKMAVEPSNKMAEQGENKANPSPAAGAARRSSASPAARASAKTTSKPSPAGKTSTRRRAGSSQ